MNRFRSSKYFAGVFASLALSSSAFLLSGCAFTGVDASGSGSDGGALVKLPMHGSVIGGQNPIKGAVIQLYQIGQSNSSSYTANAKPLISSTLITDGGGNFDITGKYSSCDPGSYLYITAAGGDPQLGNGGSGPNSSITLVASAGLCDDLATVPFIAVNEVTTVATAYAFAQFARTTPFGTPLSGQSTSAMTPAFNIATNSTNLQGIANAAAMYTLLVNPTDGTSPGSNGNGALNNPLTLSANSASGATGAVAEFWQINTIADILAACVNSGGLTSSSDTASNCGVLFSNVMPFAGNVPADTAQAALALALTPTVPTAQITKLYGIIPSTAPFLPFVLPDATAIVDFTIGVQIKPTVPGTNTELLFDESWLGIDSKGNVWVTNSSSIGTHPASLIELNPIGVPMRAGTNTGSALANYQISQYTVNGATTPTTFTGQYQVNPNGTLPGGATGPVYVSIGTLVGSIDTNDNVWVSDRGGDAVMKIVGSSVGSTHNGGNGGDLGGSGAVGYPLAAGSAPEFSFVDGSNTVWTVLSSSSQGVGIASPVKSTTCGTNSNYSTYQAGMIGFLNGNPATGAYTPNAPASSQIWAIDPNVGDTVTNNGTTTAIPGAPFIWSLSTNSALLNHQYTTGTTPGCSTALNLIGGVSTAATTRIAGVTIGTNDVAYAIGTNNNFDLAFDSTGNLWIPHASAIDVAGTGATVTVPYGLVKITPSYGSAFTPAQFVPNTTFTYFNGGMSAAFNSRTAAFDGDSNVWFAPNGGTGFMEYTNGGVVLTPDANQATNGPGPGYRGSTCTNCKFRGGGALNYIRDYNAKPTKPSFDQSGNLWDPIGGTGAASLLVLVGVAAPTVEPMSLGLKNKTLATRP
jgi:hypothetical protein